MMWSRKARANMPVVWPCCGKFRKMKPDTGSAAGMPGSYAVNGRLAIVGGGAAGLMAAITAARILREAAGNGTEPGIILLEGQERVGRKLLATGNGRCNLSNNKLSIDHYHGRDIRFALGALRRLPVVSTLAQFRQMGLLCRVDPDGRIFPYSYQAAAVLDLLRLSAEQAGVRIITDCKIKQVLTSGPYVKSSEDPGFCLLAQDGRQFRADRVIVATGGLAAPAFGCDGSGYRFFTALGHHLVEPFPALVQICTETELVRGLAGIKCEGMASASRKDKIIRSETGEVLFTEYGLSGPPLLQLARPVAEWAAGLADGPVMISLNFLPDLTSSELQTWLIERQQINPELPLADFLTGLVNKKLGQTIVKTAVGRSLNGTAGSLSAQEIQKIRQLLQNWSVRAVGTRDWSQAQVTAGGLATADFRPDTLESRLVPGLFAAGEILDIDGDCGGFNLQWAWSSGYLAGKKAAEQWLAANAAGGLPGRLDNPGGQR
ncbi:MAG: aminoacetone oxidase family FAD-binding enzyme [Clostridiaceae bacterium]|nr:aminoacetone oxidase family FAD-binding enzyme [Clostridiaceae bacterium]